MLEIQTRLSTTDRWIDRAYELGTRIVLMVLCRLQAKELV